MEYDKKIQEQIRQYSNNALRFFPPPAHHFWMQTYLRPKLRAVFGTDLVQTFYANTVLERAAPIEVLSVGSGDGELEVAIAKTLKAAGCDAFTIHITELSPIRQDRTIARVEKAGLGEHFEFHIVDFNKAFIEGAFDLIFAHHVLHHIVELEFLFDNIAKALKPGGTFATIDMIGRNGHMRWPEALHYMDMAWAFIPDHWKYNFQLRSYHENYLNWDCSKSGFEGIRAQDIQPLLVERFDFEGFVAGGGFMDVLFDRGYGQSIDIENPREKALVEFLSEMNEMLLETGRIKPTMIFAHMRRQGDGSGAPRVHGVMTPEFAIRPPEEADAKTEAEAISATP